LPAALFGGGFAEFGLLVVLPAVLALFSFACGVGLSLFCFWSSCVASLLFA
jgi:hypothetical protein